MNRDPFRKDVQRILEHGIIRFGTRYECQKKLVWHYWSLNYSPEECYEVIKHWYYSHDHQSKDWKSKPEMVLRNLKSAINSLYQNAIRKGFQPLRRRGKQLRIPDVLKIISLTRDYRSQKFSFSLLLYALNKRFSDNKFFLPWKAIIHFDCCSPRSYKGKIEFCKSIGLIELVREYDTEENRFRFYRANFNYAEEGTPVNSLEEGLKNLFSVSQVRRRYSKWYFRKIMNS
jgi:hypothetical protein